MSALPDAAIAGMDKLVRREAFVMAFNDCFFLIGWVLLISCAVILAARAPAAGAEAPH